MAAMVIFMVVVEGLIAVRVELSLRKIYDKGEGPNG